MMMVKDTLLWEGERDRDRETGEGRGVGDHGKTTTHTRKIKRDWEEWMDEKEEWEMKNKYFERGRNRGGPDKQTNKQTTNMKERSREKESMRENYKNWKWEIEGKPKSLGYWEMKEILDKGQRQENTIIKIQMNKDMKHTIKDEMKEKQIRERERVRKH